MADADPLAARIAEDRERVKAAFRELYPLHPGDVATTAQVLASGIALGTADRLLKAVEAALKLASGWAYGPVDGTSALTEDRDWVRADCGAGIREAITRALTGEAPNG
jgi:hypothetical protein